MELRHLRYFCVLAGELHFGKAAARLHISQPPLSRQIEQLETELGFLLFHRTKRTVELTAAGTVFLEEVEQIFKQLDRAVSLGRQTQRGEIGNLAIAFVSSAAYNILPVLLKYLREEHPGVSISLHELTTDRQLTSLLSGQIDLGIIRPPIDDRNIFYQPILQENLVVALPENNPLTKHKTISISQLQDEQFILFPRNLAPSLFDNITTTCQNSGFYPQVAQEAVQMQTIVSLVSAGMGISIVPASLQNLQRAGVTYRSFRDPTPAVEIGAIWRTEDKSPLLGKISTWLTQEWDRSRS
jgi:DNA-binding transcriptional LysR family regulator